MKPYLFPYSCLWTSYMLLNSSSWVWEGKYTRPFSGSWGEESSILILGTTAGRELTTVVWFSSHCLEGPSAPSRPLLAPVLPTWIGGGTHHTNTLLLLAAHHCEERGERRYDDQWHSDGHGSDGPSPRGMHWEVSKGRLLDVSSVTGSKRNIFFSF